LLFASFSNGVSYEISFSAIVCTTRNIHFSGLNKIGRTKMKFDVGEGRVKCGFGKA